MEAQYEERIRRNPWTSIWMNPRETVRQLVEERPDYAVIPLAMALGITQIVMQASSNNWGDTLSMPYIFIAAVIGGPLSGLFMLFAFPYLLHLSGKWIGGQATQEQLRTATVWGSLPVLAVVPAMGFFILRYGHEAFTKVKPSLAGDPAGFGILLLYTVWVSVFSIWSLFTYLHAVGEVQQFSAWRALGNSLLGLVIIIVPVLVLVVAGVLIVKMAAG